MSVLVVPFKRVCSSGISWRSVKIRHLALKLLTRWSRKHAKRHHRRPINLKALNRPPFGSKTNRKMGQCLRTDVEFTLRRNCCGRLHQFFMSYSERGPLCFKWRRYEFAKTKEKNSQAHSYDAFILIFLTYIYFISVTDKMDLRLMLS